MTYLKDIADYLQANSLGTFGTDIFLYGFAPGVKNCIALLGQPGLPEKLSSGDLILSRPELGVRVRNASGKTAESKANSIHALLNLTVNKTKGSTHFKRIQAISDPFLVSKSETEGTIYSINFSVEME